MWKDMEGYHTSKHTQHLGLLTWYSQWGAWQKEFSWLCLADVTKSAILQAWAGHWWECPSWSKSSPELSTRSTADMSRGPEAQRPRGPDCRRIFPLAYPTPRLPYWQNQICKASWLVRFQNEDQAAWPWPLWGHPPLSNHSQDPPRCQTTQQTLHKRPRRAAPVLHRRSIYCRPTCAAQPHWMIWWWFGCSSQNLGSKWLKMIKALHLSRSVPATATPPMKPWSGVCWSSVGSIVFMIEGRKCRAIFCQTTCNITVVFYVFFNDWHLWISLGKSWTLQTQKKCSRFASLTSSWDICRKCIHVISCHSYRL